MENIKENSCNEQQEKIIHTVKEIENLEILTLIYRLIVSIRKKTLV